MISMLKNKFCICVYRFRIFHSRDVVYKNSIPLYNCDLDQVKVYFYIEFDDSIEPSLTKHAR